MKIIDYTSSTIFESLNIGDVFKHGNYTYLKIGKTGDTMNSFNMNTNIKTAFNDCTIVQKVDAEIVIS